MPLAPPRCASTAAHTGSGSYVRRACRSVATWSILTPSSIIVFLCAASRRFAFLVKRLQVAHHAAAEDVPLLEVMVEHGAHQQLRLRRDTRVGKALFRE